MRPFTLVTATTLTGERKVVAFRDLSSAKHAATVYPEATLRIEESYQSLDAPAVWRALDRLLKGLDGLAFLELEYGRKTAGEMYDSYNS